MSRVTRIAVVADTHTWPTPTLVGGDAASAPPSGDPYCAMLLDEAQALHDLLLEQVADSGVQALIHLGDLTCGGGFFGLPPAAFAPLQMRLRADYGALPMPAFALPGNHDTPPAGGGWSLFEQLWLLGPGLGTTVDMDNWRLLLINAQGHDAEQIRAAQPGDPVYGWVSGAELARVEEAVATAQGRTVIAFVHQLLRPWQTPARAWKPYYAVRNADALLATLALRPGVRVLFQGHAHRYERGALHLNGSTALSVLAPALIEYPVGWLMVELQDDSMRVSLRQLPRADLIQRSLCDGAQAWRAPAELAQWSHRW